MFGVVIMILAATLLSPQSRPSVVVSEGLEFDRIGLENLLVDAARQLPTWVDTAGEKTPLRVEIINAEEMREKVELPSVNASPLGYPAAADHKSRSIWVVAQTSIRRTQQYAVYQYVQYIYASQSPKMPQYIIEGLALQPLQHIRSTSWKVDSKHYFDDFNCARRAQTVDVPTDINATMVRGRIDGPSTWSDARAWSLVAYLYATRSDELDKWCAGLLGGDASKMPKFTDAFRIDEVDFAKWIDVHRGEFYISSGSWDAVDDWLEGENTAKVVPAAILRDENEIGVWEVALKTPRECNRVGVILSYSDRITFTTVELSPNGLVELCQYANGKRDVQEIAGASIAADDALHLTVTVSDKSIKVDVGEASRVLQRDQNTLSPGAIVFHGRGEVQMRRNKG